MGRSEMIDCMHPFEPSIILRENWGKHHTKIRFDDPVDLEFFDMIREKDFLRRRLMKSHLRGSESPRLPVR
jgi:hypothetical protein